ncbi:MULTISPECIES: glycosyltransferase family 2 protein [Tenebrionibacter/Tenebrionicola group]|jgi:GT2 family glycosyltransferase|uniref:Glycosyltransferase family 2 protein n=2 Tax=Tenebrionibacter/Tenebrionicola group TaxID=2969848 RepID=A0A8K0XX36_9ENTR|nr:MULTISPECIES: glycosyltransferase family 2 protein [Tenebrionibacter/Tenebrionicola group]MBK4715233.1 glycosyltransferase family 2 protein [Tenebrionibacter intestinalis]MBV5094174.1 glycosyltransferase family 2 protein [Tenebrionicola larvae]
MLTNKSVIAVIVTYKRKNFLKSIIKSLSEQTVNIEKILVIDNNSSDGTEELVRNIIRNNQNISYHNTGDNLGGAGGFRYGFTKALEFNFDYLWLMDDDLLPEIDCLEKLLENCQGSGIFQPMRYDKSGNCAELSPLEYNLTNPFLIRSKTKTVKEAVLEGTINTESIFEIHSVPFEGPLITRDIIDSIGLPNAKFFIFNDDLDYSIRAKKKGYTIKCVPKAKAIRLLDNNLSADLSSWKGYFMWRNYFYINRTYGENFFVRIKPYWLSAAVFTYSLLKFDLAACKVIYHAFCDSKKLTNSELYKP